MAWDDHLPPVIKADDPKGSPGKPAPARPGMPVNRPLGLRHIMVLIAGFAVLFVLGRQFVLSWSLADAVALAMGVGLFFVAIGGWVMARFDEGLGWGWGLIVIGYIVATFAAFQFFAILSWPILAGVMISVFARKRATDQDALLGVMAIASGRSMPLAPGIEAFADQTTGASRRWARSLATLLNQGWDLPDAVEALPRTVSRPASVLIRVGSGVGAPGPALREAVKLREAQLPVLRSVGGRIAYIGWLLVLGQVVVGFLSFIILPRIEAIFADFGMSLPEPTLIVSQWAITIGHYGFLVLLAEFLLAAYLVFEISGHGLGIGSPVARLSRRRHAALILRALALAVEAGRPLGPSLATLAETYPSRSIRRRLHAASLDLADGEPWAEALFDRGLLTRAEAGVLESAGRAGNLAWAMREMAATGDRRWAYRIQAWSQVAFFLALLGAGGVVILIALAYFLPLVQLI